MVVLASVVALVPEASVSDMWGMLLLVVQCFCWCQYMHCLALYWHFDVPKCPWCICSKTFFLSPGGTMIASPHRIITSSTVNHIVHGMVIMLLEHHWYDLAIHWWLCLQGYLAVGHPWLPVGSFVSSQHWCIHGLQKCWGESLVYSQVSISIMVSATTIFSPGWYLIVKS